MKILKVLRLLLLIIFVLFTGCFIFGLYSVNNFEFIDYGMTISLLVFYVVCFIYDNKKVKEQGYDDKKISKLLLLNIFLLIIHLISYILTRDIGKEKSNELLYYLSFYNIIYPFLFPIFASKYIAYFSIGKTWLKILGIIIFIILFFIIYDVPTGGITI